MANARAEKLMNEGRPWVYDVDETDYVEGEGYAVRCVFENEPGFFKMDWRWGKDHDIELARKAAVKKNAIRGITEEQAMKIVCSSMFAKV